MLQERFFNSILIKCYCQLLQYRKMTACIHRRPCVPNRTSDMSSISPIMPMSKEEKRLAASAAPPPLRAPACSTTSQACSARAVPSTEAAPSASPRHASAASARPRPDIAHAHTDISHDHLLVLTALYHRLANRLWLYLKKLTLRAVQ